jgi:DNA replication protein DnaC
MAGTEAKKDLLAQVAAMKREQATKFPKPPSSTVPVKAKAKCRDCQNEYEPKMLECLGSKFDLSGGRCPDCRKIFVVEEDKREEVARQQQIAEQRLKWRKSCGLTGKYFTTEFGTFDAKKQPDAFKRCRDYAEKFPITNPKGYPSLVLYSEHSWGVGKTHLASAIGHRILNRWNGEELYRNPVYFTTEPDLFNYIRSTYNMTDEQRLQVVKERHIPAVEDMLIQWLIHVPLLILDDVGKTEVTDPRFVQRTLFAIIDGRDRAQLPMVITANLSPDGLRRHLGGGTGNELGNEAAYDRLLAMAKGKFIQIEGKSQRH